ncbi:ABC transporter permease [Nocardiopsis sp. NPDC058631]|uniref:ABC transporter permease n=1 Tax=Nocardiopsis sp. NPDC058631 TaxID=3346566 RepID=UPI0036462B00
MNVCRTWNRYRTATVFAITEHLRNRLALILILGFVPLWISLVHLVIADGDVTFLLRASGEHLTVNGNHISQLSGAVNAVTLIVGFMMFIVTFRSVGFDQRLVLAGYPRGHLLAAKLTALILAASAVCAYATAVTAVYWTPERPVVLWMALCGAALAFGGIGIALGVALRGELEGMFIVIMLSIIDMGLQNPVATPAADSDIVRYLPSYGSMQSGTAAGFVENVPWSHMGLGPLWFVCAVVVAGTVLWMRTRDRRAPLAGMRGRVPYRV